ARHCPTSEQGPPNLIASSHIIFDSDTSLLPRGWFAMRPVVANLRKEDLLLGSIAEDRPCFCCRGIIDAAADRSKIKFGIWMSDEILRHHRTQYLSIIKVDDDASILRRLHCRCYTRERKVESFSKHALSITHRFWS